MSLIKPTITESLFYQFFKLEADRQLYYLSVYQIARSIFLNLGIPEKVEEMNRMIQDKLEIPLKSDFSSIVSAYYNPRFMYSKRAYTKIGSSIDYVKVTKYEIQRVLEDIKIWIYDEIIRLASFVRFTRPSEIYG